jgi:hypothetical protein
VKERRKPMKAETGDYFEQFAESNVYSKDEIAAQPEPFDFKQDPYIELRRKIDRGSRQHGVTLTDVECAEVIKHLPKRRRGRPTLDEAEHYNRVSYVSDLIHNKGILPKVAAEMAQKRFGRKRSTAYSMSSAMSRRRRQSK